MIAKSAARREIAQEKGQGAFSHKLQVGNGSVSWRCSKGYLKPFMLTRERGNPDFRLCDRDQYRESCGA